MTPQLNKQLHSLLTATGLAAQKPALVISYTNGRSESSKDLTDKEAKELIRYLQSKQPANNTTANKMRRKILSMAHQLHWYLPGTQKVDTERLDNWCIHYSYLHKKLNEYILK